MVTKQGSKPPATLTLLELVTPTKLSRDASPAQKPNVLFMSPYYHNKPNNNNQREQPQRNSTNTHRTASACNIPIGNVCNSAALLSLSTHHLTGIDVPKWSAPESD